MSVQVHITEISSKSVEMIMFLAISSISVHGLFLWDTRGVQQAAIELCSLYTVVSRVCAVLFHTLDS